MKLKGRIRFIRVCGKPYIDLEFANLMCYQAIDLPFKKAKKEFYSDIKIGQSDYVGKEVEIEIKLKS
jgi:hypothetical protein